MQRTREQRIIIATSIFCAAAVGFLWLVLLGAGEWLANTILAGQGVFAHFRNGALRLLPNVTDDQRQTLLLAEIWKYAARITTIYVICQTLVLAGSLRHGNLVGDFFSAKSHPLNLAVLRVAYFVTLFPRVKIHSVVELSQLPEELRVAPPGLSWLVANLVQSETALMALYYVFAVACITGAIGLCTRVSCVTAACLAFYLLGVPQFFGKINHYHHIIWVGALLATSRCGDALSVDALWSAIRGRGSTDVVKPSPIYATPLRFVWLFLGILYFFPGFWKYVISGPQWFLSDGLVHRMWLRMYVSSPWEPIVRLDQWPLVCKFGALMTIVCEIGFIFLIFTKWGRVVIACCALSFHVLVQLTMNISFWPIHAYYVTFVDWKKLLAAICKPILKEPLVVQFDAAHARAPKWAAAVQTLDLFGRIKLQPGASTDQSDPLGLNIAGITGWKGLGRLIAYSPLCVILLPVYGFNLVSVERPKAKRRESESLAGVYIVGAVVLVGSLFCGFTMTDSWPIGVYPTFARIIEPTFESIAMDVIDPQGQTIAEVQLYFDPTIRAAYPARRAAAALGDAARRTAGRPQRLLALWNIWKQAHPEATGATRVNFYQVAYSTDPKVKSREPIQRKLLESLSASAAGFSTEQSDAVRSAAP